MASLNLSSNGPSISKSYQSVVNSSENASGSSTYAKWAIFSVSTPLTSAFQQDIANKESVLKVQDTGEGELVDLIDEFSEGKIQFAFVKVTDPNTGLPKNVLIAWCGEGVPERTKGYFTSHLSAVSKFLHGYHVQITARSERDLTAESITQRVADSSGAKYASGTENPIVTPPKPPVSSKPVFNPLRTGGTNAGMATTIAIRAGANHDDGWGPDAPPVTRTGLEKVQSAYKPTKVNMQELRSERRSETSTNIAEGNTASNDVVKGGYQPVGKVDIAAIRRQAREAGNFKDDRPEPVKGAYQPVGKVDIAAIRSRAQKVEDPLESKGNPSVPDDDSEMPRVPDSSEHSIVPGHSGRLTSLPKPRVSNKFGGGTTAYAGTRPPLPNDKPSKPKHSAPIGSARRTFADEGGKTPAQLWTERKARERGQDPGLVDPLPTSTEPIQPDHSGRAEWKSSYTGKTWAPVQTTHTGKSVASHGSNPSAGPLADTVPATEPQTSQQNVDVIRGQFMQEQPKELHEKSLDDVVEFAHTSSSSSLLAEPREHQTLHQPEAHEPIPSPPYPPRSPTPPTPPVREASPIRVAMPISGGVAGAPDGLDLAPATHVDGTLEIPNEKDFDGTRNAGLEQPAPANDDNLHASGIRAIVQYDYERAEANEIDLKEGESVTEIDMVDKDWWLGSNARGERGLFPSNYVELVEDSQQDYAQQDVHEHVDSTINAVPESGPTTAPSSKPTARALYDYEAAEDNELSFPEGAEITNVEFPDDDWWLGEYLDGRGLFPANYVQLQK